MAGTPPDYFCRTGLLRGNPVYRWSAHRRSRFAWWKERLRSLFGRFDACRLDHFIGFLRCWGVSGRARTAVGGRWIPGPGDAFFRDVFRELGPLPLIAEDLGSDGREIHWDLIRLALASVAATVIVPLQDVAGLDSRARMNVPGRAHGNWARRLADPSLFRAARTRLLTLTRTFGRSPRGSR
ncbi:MAG: 4-alpha-glucanotransferase [Candidatus Brocadiae bacterium]|nr:4-alpha-glucanotransferase [Candidatus Brocadiia bacterium]